MQNNKKVYDYITIWTEESDEILISTCPANSRMDINIVKDLVKSRLDYSQGKALYTLMDVTNMASITKEARDYLNAPDGGLKGVLGGAFLSNSITSTVIINLYLKISKPEVPAKFFTKKEDALHWLNEIKRGQK